MKSLQRRKVEGKVNAGTGGKGQRGSALKRGARIAAFGAILPLLSSGCWSSYRVEEPSSVDGGLEAGVEENVHVCPSPISTFVGLGEEVRWEEVRISLISVQFLPERVASFRIVDERSGGVDLGEVEVAEGEERAVELADRSFYITVELLSLGDGYTTQNVGANIRLEKNCE